MMIYKIAQHLFLLLSVLVIMPLYGTSDIPEKKIVVIITSYNNALYYEKNLNSVVHQNYSNYQIIYIDDCSLDGTGDLVRAYVEQHGLQDKITVISNPYNRKALYNMYRAVHMCDDQAIIVKFDGDDYMADAFVLSTINERYYYNDIWFTYGQYQDVSSNEKKIGKAKPTPQAWVDRREYRSQWIWSGIRSFYAWIYKCIKLEDLLLESEPYLGKFLPTSEDAACVYPILEMAGKRFSFIEKVLLDRNIDTPLNDFKIHKPLQVLCGKFLRNLEKYSLLHEPNLGKMEPYQNAQADVIIIADHDSSDEQVQQTLDSFGTHLAHVGTIYILDHNSVCVTNRVDSPTEYIPCSSKNFVKQLRQCTPYMTEHVIIARAGALLERSFDCAQIIKELEQTYAHMFCLSDHIRNHFAYQDPRLIAVPCEHLWDSVYACKAGMIKGFKEKPIVALLRAKDLLDMSDDCVLHCVYVPDLPARRVILFDGRA
ncbi:MAG TPA: glycosyltransferase family 2 protein [Candidatus Babeliales bacterium]|nr:glycosyltransferase family 2 protein [Candidatus Babeliales bacterium]